MHSEWRYFFIWIVSLSNQFCDYFLLDSVYQQEEKMSTPRTFWSEENNTMDIAGI